MKVSFYCGCYKTAISLTDEPLECTCSGELVGIDKNIWDRGDLWIRCPKCGAELHQNMDHFEKI